MGEELLGFGLNGIDVEIRIALDVLPLEDAADKQTQIEVVDQTKLEVNKVNIFL